MRTSTPERGSLRRRGPVPDADNPDDARGGHTTEEVSDTGVSDDPREDDPREPEPVKPAQGSTGILTRVWWRKMTIRAVMGTTMMVTFAFVIYRGHVYICILVFFLQCCIFWELVNVRKKQAAERRLPLFRSIQWAWFLTAAFFTWSAAVCEFLIKMGNVRDDQWMTRFLLEKNIMICFSLYVGLLMISVLSLRKGLYKYQITQYTWTIVTICIVVFQTQAVFQIVYAGLFWFVLPSSLVICNDIMAYYCGQVFGKKLIRRRFLELSPNKTWEGFLGSAICTLIFAFWMARKLAGMQWMTCVPEEITLRAHALSCEPAPMYRLQSLQALADDNLPSRLREALRLLTTFAPSIMVPTMQFEICLAQIHALCLGLFASFAAPFGGFLSSAIKRAYGIKDFNNLIPGHGGMMDRFDCQFVMFLCTYVHHRTFCSTSLTVGGLLASARQLSLSDQQDLLDRLREHLLAKGLGTA